MFNSGLTRRAFMVDLGKGGLAIAVLGLTTLACSGDDSADSTVDTSAGAPEQPTTADPGTTSASTTTANDVGYEWERVNLGFVSAYVLARRGEGVIVDTGVSNSERDIEASLAVLDLAWGDVSSVIITHLHDDHQGSLPAVMNLASDATGYAGAGDISSIASPRELVAVGNGDTVFDLKIIETPGHTPGHISVLDEAGGLLLAGDALTGSDGGVAGVNPQYSEDLVTADASVRRLAGFTYDTVVFGHGEPVVGNASRRVAEFAASI